MTDDQPAEPVDSAVAALRAQVRPRRIVLVHRHRFLLRAGARSALTVADGDRVLWAVIAVAGLWLGLLGIAMATGLAIVLRSGQEIPEDYWRSIIDYPTPWYVATADVARVVDLPVLDAVEPSRPQPLGFGNRCEVGHFVGDRVEDQVDRHPGQVRADAVVRTGRNT